MITHQACINLSFRTIATQFTTWFLLTASILLIPYTSLAKPWENGKLVVNLKSGSPQLAGRFLTLENDTPFFWLGDTAWGIFRNSFIESNPDMGQPYPLEVYFATRAAQGFNVVQTQLLPLTDISDNRTPGVDDANVNAYGQLAIKGGNTTGDFSRPQLHKGNQIYDYWDHVDRVIKLAEEHGIYLVIVPAWNNHLPKDQSPSVVTDPSVAYDYGHFLGKRYSGNPNIIWMLGGDAYSLQRQFNKAYKWLLKDMNFAMAEGITDGVQGIYRYDDKAEYQSTLMTLHPRGGRSSKELKAYRQAPWMDFDSIQTALSADKISGRNKAHTYDTVARDYASKTRVRPTLEAEVSYEHSARSFQKPIKRVDAIPTTPWESRRSGYLAVFAGSLGYTYGHINLIHFLRAGQTSDLGANRPWYTSLGIDLDSSTCPNDFSTCRRLQGSASGEASTQLIHLRNLVESRFLTDQNGKPQQDRVPDQTILDKPDRNLNRFMRLQAMRASDGRYLMVYSSNGREFGVDMSKLSGKTYNAWWYNPRDGLTYIPDGRASPDNAKPFLQNETNDGRFKTFDPPGNESPPSQHVSNDPPDKEGIELFRNQKLGNDWVLVLDDAAAGFTTPGILPAPLSATSAQTL